VRSGGTIEEVIEPFLIQRCFRMRTSSGRIAAERAEAHLGFQPPAGPTVDDLFGDADAESHADGSASPDAQADRRD
jgi:Holliday junction resolvasome, helicase subunit